MAVTIYIHSIDIQRKQHGVRFVGVGGYTLGLTTYAEYIVFEYSVWLPDE